MKKFLILLTILSLIFAVVLAAFILTFDIDRYKPQIENELAKWTDGKPVIDELSLDWDKGISIGVYGFSVLRDGQTPLEADRLSLVLNLASLLKRKIQVVQILIDRPVLQLEKAADGEIRVDGIQITPQATSDESNGAKLGQSQSSNPSTATYLTSFLVEVIELRRGKVTFIDAQYPGEKIQVNGLDVKIENVSLTRPIDFSVDCMLWSDEQNLSAKGRLHSEGLGNVWRLDHLDMDFNFTEAAKHVPQPLMVLVKQNGLAFLPEAQGSVSVEDVTLMPFSEKGINGKLQFDKVKFAFLGSPLVFSEFKGGIRLNEGFLSVENIDGRVGQGTLSGAAKVEKIYSAPSGEYQLKLNRFNLLAAQRPTEGAPAVEGILDFEVSGHWKGWDREILERTLKSEGVLTIEKGLMRNTNILRDMLEKLNTIPSLQAALDERMSDDFKSRMARQDTVLKSIYQPFKVEVGILTLDPFSLATEDLKLEGRGKVALDQSMAGTVKVALHPNISEELVSRVHELKYLMNANNEIEMPATVSGRYPQIAIFPDLQALGAKLLQAKAGSALQDLLGSRQKAKTPVTAAPEGEAKPASEASESEPAKKPDSKEIAVGLLNDFLNQAFSGSSDSN